MPNILMKKTETVWIDNVPIGGNSPVVVQSMTNTDTSNVEETTKQIIDLYKAGSELVRITVNHAKAAEAVPFIKDNLLQRDINVPIIGDFHYNGHKLLTQFPTMAQTLSKYRINPGNTGTKARDTNFCTIVEQAIKYNKPIRIGVNGGSIDQQLLTQMMDKNHNRKNPKTFHEVELDTMIESAIRSSKLAQNVGLDANKIIISCKLSNLPNMVYVYRILSQKTTHPLHLGLTEAGMGLKGIVSSSAALSILLSEGIGNTIRVSLTPEPNGDRTEEVRICQVLLQSLKLKNFAPEVISCPGCGRTQSIYFQKLAQEIQNHINVKLYQWKKQYPRVTEMVIAVMGCVVNGPGESKHANIGISLPGTFEEPKAPVYVDGKHHTTLRGSNISKEFMDIIHKYIIKNYAH